MITSSTSAIKFEVHEVFSELMEKGNQQYSSEKDISSIIYFLLKRIGEVFKDYETRISKNELALKENAILTEKMEQMQKQINQLQSKIDGNIKHSKCNLYICYKSK